MTTAAPGVEYVTSIPVIPPATRASTVPSADSGVGARRTAMMPVSASLASVVDSNSDIGMLLVIKRYGGSVCAWTTQGWGDDVRRGCPGEYGQDSRRRSGAHVVDGFNRLRRTVWREDDSVR